MPRLLVALLLPMLVLFASAAQARERLVVLMLADQDPALSENLTEVAIAKLAERGTWDLVGSPELMVRLNDIPTVQRNGLASCLSAPSCLGEIGVLAGANVAVVGRVRAGASGFVLTVAFLDLQSGVALATVPTKELPSVAELAAAVQMAVEELTSVGHARTPVALGRVQSALPAAAAAPPPPVRPTPAPAPASVTSNPPTPAARYVAYAATGLALVALSTGIVMGTIGSAPPNGDTRAEKQADLARRQNLVTGANVLYATAAGAGVIAVVAFTWH